jgi:hypothetical protein
MLIPLSISLSMPMLPLTIHPAAFGGADFPHKSVDPGIGNPLRPSERFTIDFVRRDSKSCRSLTSASVSAGTGTGEWAAAQANACHHSDQCSRWPALTASSAMHRANVPSLSVPSFSHRFAPMGGHDTPPSFHQYISPSLPLALSKRSTSWTAVGAWGDTADSDRIPTISSATSCHWSLVVQAQNTRDWFECLQSS